MTTIRSKKGKDVSSAMHRLVISMTKKCLREICKKEHEVMYADECAIMGLPSETHRRLTTNIAYQFIKVETRCRSRHSYGGEDGIIIDVSPYQYAIDHCTPEEWSEMRFTEYPAFKNDPRIGSIFCDNPEICLLALVAHEVAHHVQYRYGPYTRHLKKKYQKPHGEGFRYIYGLLRSRLINKHCLAIGAKASLPTLKQLRNRGVA
jgi:hypothetical protein